MPPADDIDSNLATCYYNLLFTSDRRDDDKAKQWQGKIEFPSKWFITPTLTPRGPGYR